MTERLVLLLPEAAELLGLTPQQLYEITRARSRSRQTHPIPYIKLGKRLAFRRQSLEAWLIANEKNGKWIDE